MSLSLLHGVSRSLFLAGAIIVAGASVDAFAGQPIKFSAPRDEESVPLPPRRDLERIKLPKSTLKWPEPVQDMDLPPPQPVQPIDPRMQKKWREMQEERKNWLINEPAIFKDKFADPFGFLRSDFDGSENPLDSRVERVLGKPEEKKLDASDPLKRPSSLSSRDPFFEKQEKQSSSALEPLGGDREQKDKNREKNTLQMTVKSLFDSDVGTERLGVQPGMSLYQIFERSKTKAEKLEDEARHQDFLRLIGGAALTTSVSTKEKEKPGLLDQPSGTSTSPEKAGRSEGLNSRQSPFSAMTPPNPLERPSLPLPFENPTRYQPTSIPQQQAQDKARQMQSLKLMSRPAVLEMPGARH